MNISKLSNNDETLCQIRIETLTSQNVFIVAKYHETKIRDIIQKFLENYKNNVPNIVQFFSKDLNQYLEDDYLDKTVYDLGLGRNIILKLEHNWTISNNKMIKQIDENVAEIKKNMNKENYINVKIKTLTGYSYDLKIDPNIKISELKILASKINLKNIDEQRLIYRGYQLSDDYTFEECRSKYKPADSDDEDIITIVLRMRGGMYHETSGKNGNYGILDKLILVMDGIELKN